jgi:small-conductance mechanosensitive channel
MVLPSEEAMSIADIVARINEVVWLKQLVIVFGSILIALLVALFFKHILRLFTRKTETDIDDRVADALRGPALATIILLGLSVAFGLFEAPPLADKIVRGTVMTVIALLWAGALMKVGRIFLEVVSQQVDRIKWIEPRTLPLLDMVLKVLTIGGFLYAVCIAWNIPLTSWLASAGVIGIAVGFAAKDTLSNLFSGIFIVADSPYEIGDYVVLDNSIRGEVLEIGMRSTRLLTRDDIEVTVPNAVIANAQIINQTGGPHEKMRVRIKVEAAYGSDVDQVEEVLLGSVDGVANVCEQPAPRVRFREFGASGLVFELLAWIDEPVYRGRVMHKLNGNVYKSMNAAGIEIPYAKQDVYVKEMPQQS